MANDDHCDDLQEDDDASEKWQRIADETAELRTKQKQLFAEIVQCMASGMGAGPLAALTDDALSPLVAEALDACERWDADVEMEMRDAAFPTTLQALLKEH
jgi:hypothetical protein